MIATKTETQIIQKLRNCSFQPGSFDKKFPREVDENNISPLQRWWIYKLGYKYRKQIGNDALEVICKNYIATNPEPQTRRESEKALKRAAKLQTL